MTCASNSIASSSQSTGQSCLSSATDADVDSDADGVDYVVVDKTSMLSAAAAVDEADKNVNKLLKFVADNDIQMVNICFSVSCFCCKLANSLIFL